MISEMSLVCETIMSDDELSQTQSHNTNGDDEELDYEEEEENKSGLAVVANSDGDGKQEDDDRDEGELVDDDDLEEGEVKEDDDEDGHVDDRSGQQSQRKRITAPESGDGSRVNSGNNNANNTTSNNICRFYRRGQCTWGNACRFLHPPEGMSKRMLPIPPPMPPMPPIPPHMSPHPPNARNRSHNRDFYDSSAPPHASHPPQSESAWERGLIQAKEMMARASRRKEEEVDFEDKRFNLSVEENVSRQSRDSSHSPISENRLDNDEYERRRRLAFESAPWNNDEPVSGKTRSAESYRDPWRRSKSPPTNKYRRQFAGSRSSKRSHSMSSISASNSGSSDFSGSDDSDSLSESSASNVSNKSADRARRRYNRRIPEKKNDLPSNRKVWNRNDVQRGAYDSWSESLSESDSVSSSSGSEDSELSEFSDKEGKPKQRIPTKRTSVNARKEETTLKRSNVEGDGPAVKKNKSSNDRKNTPLSPLLPTNKGPKAEFTSQTTVQESQPKKSPIKMTFFKTHSTLKKDNFLAAKLNGGRDNDEPAEATEEILSPKRSICSSSPVSQDALISLTPPPPQNASSSASSGGSLSKIPVDKQSARREELLQQLKAVEDAIARKKSKIN